MFLPPGYITVADAIDADQSFFSEVDHDRAVEDSVYDLGVCLAGGALESFGWDVDTGEVLPLPMAVWGRRNSQGLMARRRHLLELQSAQGSRAVIPLVEVAKLSERYGPPDLFRAGIPKFDSNKWDWGAPDSSGSTLTNSENVQHLQNKGGRTPTYDWEGYWIQAVLLADLNGLGDDEEGWSKFQADLDEWVTMTWIKQPDASTLRRKKALLKEAWAKHKPSAGK